MTTATEKKEVYGVNDLAVVNHKGKQIVLPEGMSMERAIVWLTRRLREENQQVDVHEVFDLDPAEGAVALGAALHELYGWTSMKGTKKQTFFGEVMHKPQLVSVSIGFGQEANVPWGSFQIPGMGEEDLITCRFHWRRGSPHFSLAGEVRRRHVPELRVLFEKIKVVAAKRSIYKGQAIRFVVPPDDSEDWEDHLPQFIDLRAVDENDLIFPKVVQDMVDDNIFGPVRNTQEFLAAGIPLKTGILLEGPYGCGKTLTAKVLAKVCRENEWTFIMIDKPVHLSKAVEFARRYEPAVIFCEDVDSAMKGIARTSVMNDVLNTIDGIESKGTKLMVVLTTNHVELINKAMLRPGRLDVVIPVSAPDAEAVSRLMRSFGGKMIAKDADISAAARVLDGQIPAIIRETVERSKRTAVCRRGSATFLEPSDLERAANGMLRHVELLNQTPPEELSEIEKAAKIMTEGVPVNPATSNVLTVGLMDEHQQNRMNEEE